MMGRTHLLLGLNTLWLFRLAPTPHFLNGNELGPLAGAAALGSLLPDLDAAGSLLQSWEPARGVRPFQLPARLIHQALGHRGMLHSLLGMALLLPLAVPLGLWLGAGPALALLLGYASHLAGDAATRSGIPLLFPDSTRRHLLPPRLRLTTGSQAEDVLFALLAAGATLLLVPIMLTT